MTAPESFVSRWARLKRGSDIAIEIAPAETTVAQPEIAATAEAPFDPASLPSIETIDLNTDIRGFLQSRVPAALTRAALRQAWASDPAIRDFIGIAENQWDFNDPDAMPGFGPLPQGYDVSSLLSQAIGSGRDRLAEAIPEISDSLQQPLPAVTLRAPGVPGLDMPRPAGDEPRHFPQDQGGEMAASTNDQAEADDRPRNQHRHGSALPRQDG
jgi:Protein of unknown function (DUF3306)